MQPEMIRPSADSVAGNAAPTGDAHLRELAVAALRRAAHAARLQDGVDQGVRELMREACTVARARGMHAEEVLIVVKESWRKLPEGLGLPRHEAGDVLARAITVCIDEYYGPERRRRE